MSEGNNEKARAEAMDRLLARALRHTEPGGGADCPEPDILAAYSERTLSNREARYWEEHFSQCQRCQQTLAALATSQLETPPAARERVAGAAAARSEHRRARQIRWPAWRWLAPVAAVAAAVAIWIVGRPASPWREAPPQLAQKESSSLPASVPPVAPPSSEQLRAETANKETGSSSDQPENAQGTKLESSPSTRQRIAPRKEQSASEADRLDREEFSRSGGPVNPRAATAGAAPGGLPAPPTGQAVQRDKSSSADGRFKEKSLEPSAEQLQQEQKKQPQQKQATKDAFVKANPTPGSEAVDQGKAPAKRSHLAERKSGVRQTGGLDSAQSNELRGRLSLMEAAVAPQIISPPTGLRRWRIGAAGRIERSTDGGVSWQPQSSGVIADLSAGSAPSESVCWVVGRSGTILRTTDGEHWEKIDSPAMLDWSRVNAQDSLHAGISTHGDRLSRLFVTADGGRTWRLILP